MLVTFPSAVRSLRIGRPLLIHVRSRIGQNPVIPLRMIPGHDQRARSARAVPHGGAAVRIAHEALALQEAGCFSLVFEAIPAALAAELMPRIEIPVIGIGAGPATDGQVLVFHDLLGIREGRGARFVQRYADLQEEMNAGVAAYAADVRGRRYPGPEHGYSIDDGELARVRAALAAEDAPKRP